MVGPPSTIVVFVLLVSGAWAGPVNQTVSSCDQEPGQATTTRPSHAGTATGSAATSGAGPRTPTYPCPAACYCPPDHPGAIYCDGRELHDVPRIPGRARFVYLQNNEIEALSECDTRDAGRLLGLNLDGNVLTSPALPRFALRPLRGLLQLHLERNQLTEVPLGLPASLEDLRLAHNAIALVPGGAFAWMPRLRSLDLRANRLGELPDGAFSGLWALAHFNLAGNRLRAMPPKPPSPFLYQLILSDNAIESVPEDYVSSFPRLAWLDLGNNALGAQQDGGLALGGGPSAPPQGNGSLNACVATAGNKVASDAGGAGRNATAVATEAANGSACGAKVGSESDGRGARSERPRGFSERTFVSRALVSLRLSFNHLRHVPAFHNNLVQLHLDGNDIEDMNTSALCGPHGREPPRLSYFRLEKNPIMDSPQAPVTLGKIMHCFPYLQPMV